MINQQEIIRHCTFDSGHRVMNEKMKCFNLHGHTYKLEVYLSFDSMRDIGYPLDFKEIKRVGLQWIDDTVDHGVIVNPKDESVIRCAEETGSKIWYMSLNGKDAYCNPTVENIAKEMLLALELLLNDPRWDLKVSRVRVWETPNCSTLCPVEAITPQERRSFRAQNEKAILDYKTKKGELDYDDRSK